MRPTLSQLYPPHLSLPNTILSGNRSLWSGIGADGEDHRRGNLCLRQPLSGEAGFSAFGLHVGHIGGLRIKPKMVDIDTSGNVATMTDAQSARDGAVHPFPHQPMRGSRLSLPLEAAVSGGHQPPCPQRTTAFIGWGGVVSEAFAQRPVTRNHDSTKCFHSRNSFHRGIVGQGRRGVSSARRSAIISFSVSER